MAGLTLSLTAAASAQLPDSPGIPDDPNSAAEGPTAPGGPIDQNIDAGENNPDAVPDTDYTPHYKEISELWSQVGGAEFPTTELVEGSPTDFSDALFAVSFRNPNRGFAGGQSCHDEAGEVPEPGTEELGECVPVLYSYTDSLQLGPRWEKVDLPGDDEPGFVGAIAWISPTRALAVGGSGTYPRRERELSDEQVATCIAEGVEAAQAAGEDPRSALTPAQVEIVKLAWDALENQSPEAIAVLEEAGFGRSEENDLHYRPVKRSGSVAFEKARTECANRLREQNDLEAGAGAARVWVYDAGRAANDGWDELGEGELPGGMGALTALGFDPAAGVEFGFAGGLGRLWQWEGGDGNGHFTKRFDRHSPVAEVYNAPGLRYRVREIRFVPMAVPGERQAFAVTGGCCPGDGLGEGSPERGGRILAYGCEAGCPGGRRWYVRRYADPLNSGVGLFPTGGRTVTEAVPVYEPEGETSRLDHRRDLPDSFYSLTVTPKLALSVLASPGGPERDGEGSLMTQPLCAKSNGLWHSASLAGYSPGDWDPAVELARRHWLSSARLVAADGDSDRSSLDLVSSRYVPTDPSLNPEERWIGGPSDLKTNDYLSGPDSIGSDCAPGVEGDIRPDGAPDWVVGELRSTHRAGLGTRGLVYGNNLRPPLQPGTIDSPCTSSRGPVGVVGSSGPRCGELDSSKLSSGEYRPTDPVRLSAWLASKYFRLPSYSLSEIDVVGESGHGWAVGEHGALLRLSDSGSDGGGGAEPSPPRLPPPSAARPPESSAYDGSLPAGSGLPADAVPALASRERLSRDQPELVPWGSPAPATVWPRRGLNQLPRDMAISRDGDEGWAVGSRSRGERTTLMHFDGEAWSNCVYDGIPGQVEPDPACASLENLARYTSDDGPHPVQLLSVARVPYELDGDPSNDDEFEVWALGTNYRQGAGGPEAPVLARYRDGRWELVPFAERAAVDFNAGYGIAGFGTTAQIAFTTPSEGWVLSGGALHHYDGEEWTDCAEPGAAVRCGLGEHNGFPFDVGQPPQIVTAGGRAFLFGSRQVRTGQQSTYYPIVLSKAPGENWTADAAHGGLDPGFGASPSNAVEGDIGALAILPAREGEGWEGFAIGGFSTDAAGETALLRLDRSGWAPYDDAGPVADDYGTGVVPLVGGARGRPLDRTLAAAFRDRQGRLRAEFSFANPATRRLLSYDPERERWEIVNGVTPTTDPDSGGSAEPLAIAPDGQGGAWVATRGYFSNAPAYFFRHTDRPPEPILTEAPSPQAAPTPRFTALAAQPDGTVWLGTASDALYRYRRGIGWDRTRIPGWDPGRVVTRPSELNAIAVNAAGVGVAVGERGRIAAISPYAVALDRAAGRALCSAQPAPPCGTGYTLRAVSVAPDGSAMVGGDRLSLLWRPAHGEFRAIERPAAAGSSTITGLSMPSVDRAWLATDSGLIFAGTRAGESWSWSRQPENRNSLGDPLSLDERGEATPLRALSLDSQGRGYAVGDRGLALFRSSENPSQPWVRIPPRYRDSYTSVTMGAGGSSSALIGAHSGAVFTATGADLSPARFGDWVQGTKGIGESNGPVVGLALTAGVEAGQTEAWAALSGPGSSADLVGSGSDFPSTGPNRLLHFASATNEPLLDPQGGASPLPDAPAARSGEIALGVLGKSHCESDAARLCPFWADSTNIDEGLARRTVDEVAKQAPALALFTGDAIEGAGRPDQAASAERRLRRFSEQVPRQLSEAGVPYFGALGVRDLSRPEACTTTAGTTGCVRVSDLEGTGESGAWRAGMASAPAPWGGGDPPELDGYQVVPVPGGDHAQRTQEGAATHYALDLVRSGEEKLRLIFADTSSGSLAGTPDGQPAEPTGQAAWLQQMLCRTGGSNSNGPCTRGESEPAVVVSTTPTYSYGPGQAETAADAAVLESLLLEGEATALVSGRIGWNGLYWTCAAGVHHPQPGGAYPTGPPQPGQGGCGSVLGGGGTQPAAEDGSPGLPSDPLGDTAGTGLLPTLVSSSAGGPLEPGTSPPEGGWHGYSLVRVPASGDPREVVVEQRPVLDWIQIQADSHVVRAGKRLALRGFGREPVGVQRRGASIFASQEGRYDEISTAAITHRYALLAADADRPWLPQEGDGDCAPYACLDSRVGTIDDQSGQVRAGNGQYSRTYAIAQLSVGEQSATYPLVFEPRASFPSPAPPPPVPVAVPAPPPPPAAAPPTTPQVNLPSAPVLPVLTAQALAPPPAPPSPPTFASQAPLDPNISPAALDVTPPTAVSQPPTPPVNPAPPSGARREARQRQAAAQKSGADSDQESSETQELGGDTAEAPHGPGHASTRNDFTALAHREQPSAWARDALLGGGLGMAALLLALGVNIARPTPRRREPEQPAPAFARARRR